MLRFELCLLGDGQTARRTPSSSRIHDACVRIKHLLFLWYFLPFPSVSIFFRLILSAPSVEFYVLKHFTVRSPMCGRTSSIQHIKCVTSDKHVQFGSLYDVLATENFFNLSMCVQVFFIIFSAIQWFRILAWPFERSTQCTHVTQKKRSQKVAKDQNCRAPLMTLADNDDNRTCGWNLRKWNATRSLITIWVFCNVLCYSAKKGAKVGGLYWWPLYRIYLPVAFFHTAGEKVCSFFVRRANTGIPSWLVGSREGVFPLGS